MPHRLLDTITFTQPQPLTHPLLLLITNYFPSQTTLYPSSPTYPYQLFLPKPFTLSISPHCMILYYHERFSKRLSSSFAIYNKHICNFTNCYKLQYCNYPSYTEQIAHFFCKCLSKCYCSHKILLAHILIGSIYFIR